MPQAIWKLLNWLSPEYRRMAAFIERYSRLDPARARQQTDLLLYRYLDYCRTYSRYWRERWPSQWQSFTPAEADAVLASLPTLTKTDLRENIDALRIRPEDRRPGDGFPRLGRQSSITSGGSTGTPVTIYLDSHYAARLRASYDFFYRQAGLEPGEPFFFLWGSPNELKDIRTNWRKRFSSWLRGVHMMPAFGLTPERMDDICRQIREQPRVRGAMCYVTATDLLARYMQSQQIEVPKLDRVMTGGGLLSDQLRTLILKHLAREVFNFYAGRDLGVVAFETPAHDGLSLAQWQSRIEVLDHRGQCVPDGGTGQIHVTQFWNYSCALIRMASGDTARWHKEPGRNKLPTPRLSEIQGRMTEHLLAPNGAIIDPLAVIHIVGVLVNPPWLRKFQLVQRQPDQFELLVESFDAAVSGAALDQLREKLQSHLCSIANTPLQVSVRHVENIPTMASGKHSYCRREFPTGAEPLAPASAGNNA